MDDGLATLEWLRVLCAECCLPDTSVNDGSRYRDAESMSVVRLLEDMQESVLVTNAGLCMICSAAVLVQLVCADESKLMLQSWHRVLSMHV